MTGHMIIGNSKSFCDGIKITDRVTLCEASNKKSGIGSVGQSSIFYDLHVWSYGCWRLKELYSVDKSSTNTCKHDSMISHM